MSQKENFGVNIKEQKSISNQSLRIDSSQSNVIHVIDNTKFQNPVFKIAAQDNMQSFSENKYSHIFSSIIQSTTQEEQQQNLNQQGIQQIPNKRAFSVIEVDTTKKDNKYNSSKQINIKKTYTVSSTRELECKRKEDQILLNAVTPKLGCNQLYDSVKTIKQKVDQSKYYSPRLIDRKLNDNASVEGKQTQTTTWGSITSKSELDQILKECLLNFEKNKAIKTDEYIACLIF